MKKEDKSLVFSPFAAVSLFGVAGLQRPFHLSRSVAHSSLTFQAFRSLLIVSYHRNSSALPLHLHFNNCSDVFSFISPFDMPKPFQPSPSHNRRYRFHLCFFQDLLNCIRCSNRLTPIAPFSSLLLPDRCRKC